MRTLSKLALAAAILASASATKAAALFQRSVTISEKAFGKDGAAVGKALGDLAECYEFQARYGEAFPLRERSLAILEKSLGSEHPDVAFALAGLASACRRAGNYERALILAQRGLNVAERSCGAENPRLTVFLVNLATIYFDQGHSVEALQLCRRALNIDQNAFGESHPSVVTDFNLLALAAIQQGDFDRGCEYLSAALRTMREYFTAVFLEEPESDMVASIEQVFLLTEMYHALCGQLAKNGEKAVKATGAERLSLDKALSEEVRSAQAAAEFDLQTSTQELWERYQTLRSGLAHLSEVKLDAEQRETKRRQLQAELSGVESQLAERVALLAQTMRERNLKLADIARSLPPQSVLVDLIQYRDYDFHAKTNQWKEQRYAAYLTFPLARDSTNVSVERVDLGEAAPINECIAQFYQLLADKRIAPKRIEPVLQRLSELVYAPLARHLTNVSHLIICPDGQLSRVPFEMLRVGDRFLIEEQTISYVTSGREIVRLANPTSPRSNVQSPKSLVMGAPDFDLDLSKAGSASFQLAGSAGIPARSSADANQDALPLAGRMPALRSLSRDYRGITFKPLLFAEPEARSVAKLLGGDCVLRVGPEAREAELKAAVSPRVLHLATHGFFLSDQDFKRTNALRDSWIGNSGTRWNASLPKDEWENPLVRCGIALAGANHAGQITNAVAEDGVLTGLEASLLNLQGTELVILSACDTGKGEVRIGEGVMSLRRAFRIAGAQTVLASQWPVNDKATSQLMTEFIRRWRSGEPRAKAWREAQLSLLHSKEFASPYFWAAFTLTGQWN
jgi:CHAT domain-containing protein